MNLFILTCLLCFVVCSTLATQGSDASAPQAADVGGPVIADPHSSSSSSSDGLQRSPDDDDDDKLAVDVEQDGTSVDAGPLDTDLHPKEGKKKKGKGRKRGKAAGRVTPPSNPQHTLLTSGYTSTPMTTQDPCTSTHEHYCVHGDCKYFEGLQEPVCTCWKTYFGERCETPILILGSQGNESGGTGLTQTVLVIIAVVLSVLSCLAVLLVACAHYRSRKNLLASYLGTATEQEKLQNHAADVVV